MASLPPCTGEKVSIVGRTSMAEGVDELCGKLSLVGGKATGISVIEGEIAEGREIGKRCLVGKIGIEKKVNKKAFKSMLLRLWRIGGKMVFKEVQDNVWLFEFSDEEDKRQILEGCP